MKLYKDISIQTGQESLAVEIGLSHLTLSKILCAFLSSKVFNDKMCLVIV